MPDRSDPTVLIVRDGWGHNPYPEHDAFNAVNLAQTPHCDSLLRDYPWTLIRTSGQDVGLPHGTMGNSEVGHQNIGAGRIVVQEMVRISKAIQTGAFFENKVLCRALTETHRGSEPVHLLGIASDAGVHGLLSHLFGCLQLCKQYGRQAVIHLFTDGRDTGPFTARGFIEQIEGQCTQLGVGMIGSICGRYYAMDRDNRWERTEQAYDLLTGRSEGLPVFKHAVDAVSDYYDRPTEKNLQGDEFITPRFVGDWRATRIQAGQCVIFYNYRGDRPRQITRAFVMPEFFGQMSPSPETGNAGFDRGSNLNLCFVTMTAYDEGLAPWVRVAFAKPKKMVDIGGAYLSRLDLGQFRCAETEKFPHITFFFNDYREEPFPGESRRMAQSPKVATYDLEPKMSARDVTQCVLKRLLARNCEHFILVNFANADMVGHTGDLNAAISAVEMVDQCVGKIVAATLCRGGRLVVTADHGNAEQMFNPQTNARHTAHTTYDVECIIVDRRYRSAGTADRHKPSTALRENGRLADVLPTVLDLMAVDKPKAMTGRSLLAV